MCVAPTYTITICQGWHAAQHIYRIMKRHLDLLHRKCNHVHGMHFSEHPVGVASNCLKICILTYHTHIQASCVFTLHACEIRA